MPTDPVAFVTALANLSVTGITKCYSLGETPPEQVPPAHLPAQWVESSGFRTERATFDGEYQDRNRATIIIAVGEIGTSTSTGVLYSAAMTLATALRTALVAADKTDSIADGGIFWDTSIGKVDIAGSTYLAVITTVQANPL